MTLQATQEEARAPKLVEYSCPCCNRAEYQVLYPATVADLQRLSAEDFDCTNPGHGEHFRIVRCRSCDMVYCSPRPTVADLVAAYAGGHDESYVAAEDGRQRTFANALKSFPPGRGRLLDVGCNTGVFLEQARIAGFECYGIEPSHFAARRAREAKGFDVFCGAVPCELPWKEKFDVITLWDVIEHVDDPMATAMFLRDSLKPGGRLHLSTMDIGSLYARISGRSWPWLMKMHVHYFSRRTIEALLLRAGFTKVKIGSYSHIVHESYLTKKLEHVALPLRLIGKCGAAILRDREGYIRVNMGDMMHVVATR